MKKIVLLWILLPFLYLKTQAQTISDIDGNTYNTVAIGAQVWMKENLKTTRFSNGDSIGTSLLAVNNDSSSIYQWSYNDDTINTNIYGRLYTWYAVADKRNVCPSGWHVPSDSEWVDLGIALGGDSVAGAKMKETGISHWSSTDGTVDNSSGFTGIPGGFRGNPSGYIDINTKGHFWSATQWGSSSFLRAYTFLLKSDKRNLEQSVAVGNCGLSVRCLKNASTHAKNIFPKDKIRVFPNPATEQMNIQIEELGNIKASIYDICGVLVVQKELNTKTNLIDLHHLAKGTYILKMEGKDFRTEQQFVKE